MTVMAIDETVRMVVRMCFCVAIFIKCWLEMHLLYSVWYDRLPIGRGLKN